MVRLDAASFAFSVVGVVQGYVESAGALAALDARGGVLYMLLQSEQGPPGPSSPFWLVGASTRDGAVVSSAKLCASLDACPWNLAYL